MGPPRMELAGMAEKGARVLQELVHPKWISADKSIPLRVVDKCEGIAFISIMKMGVFFVSANAGTGVIISKVPDASDPRGYRWSGPASVMVGGLGGGIIFGGEKVDLLVFLNTQKQVKAFYDGKQVTIGGNLSLAVGPAGRDAKAEIGMGAEGAPVAAYSYSKAVGLYFGATLEGAYLKARDDDNAKCYGEKVTMEQILTGKIEPPPAAQVLANELEDLIARRGTYNESHLKVRSSESASSAMASRGKALLRQGISSDEELAEGWTAQATESGQRYYWNEATEDSSWEKPLKPTSKPKKPTKTPPPPPPPQRQQQVRKPALAPRPRLGELALFSYEAQQPDELSFARGNRVRIVEKPDSQWWVGELRGTRGLVPSNYFATDTNVV